LLTRATLILYTNKFYDQQRTYPWRYPPENLSVSPGLKLSGNSSLYRSWIWQQSPKEVPQISKLKKKLMKIIRLKTGTVFMRNSSDTKERNSKYFNIDLRLVYLTFPVGQIIPASNSSLVRMTMRTSLPPVTIPRKRKQNKIQSAILSVFYLFFLLTNQLHLKVINYWLVRTYKRTDLNTK